VPGPENRGGRHIGSVQLHEARSQAECRDRIRDYAAKLPKGRWIVGGDWDQENWSPARLPTHALVDSVSGDHLVFVNPFGQNIHAARL
jgi:predicted amidohydrolase YtcJ